MIKNTYFLHALLLITCVGSASRLEASWSAKIAQAKARPFIQELLTHNTQTVQHLKANPNRIKNIVIDDYINYELDSKLITLVKNIIALEEQEQAKGRYTFVHGQQWHHHFYQEIYTDLYDIANAPLHSIVKAISNYRFIRYHSQPTNQDIISKQRQLRKAILNNREVHQDSVFQNKNIRQRLLFMNYAFFAYHPYSGENSAEYIKYNRNIVDHSFNSSTLLSKLKLNVYLNQKEWQYVIEQLNDLQQKHAELSRYGNLLLLSFDAAILAKTVYVAKPYGHKHYAIIEGIGETTDVKLILDTLRTSPEKIKNSDEIIFCCILTKDCALKPNNGVDIYALNAANQEELAAWHTQKDELMTWIRERVTARRCINTPLPDLLVAP